MNATEEALILALLREPDDLLLRSIYADFLEERNGPDDQQRMVRIRARLSRPYAEYIRCPECNGLSYPGYTVNGDYYHDGRFVERPSMLNCDLCERTGKVTICHSDEWLLGYDADKAKWYAGHVDMLATRLGMVKPTLTPSSEFSREFNETGIGPYWVRGER